MTAQVDHALFPPRNFPELTVTAYLSALRRDGWDIADGYRWLVNAGDPKKFIVLHPSQMLGLVTLALANQWLVKGYTPQETQTLIKPE